MTLLRVRLRAGAEAWQQIARCEPELDAIVARAGEVERWGDGLPLTTRALATARAGDEAFTLIAVPDLGSAWVASAALQPGDADGEVVVVEATTAYATRTRCEWRAAAAPALASSGDWVEVDRGAQADWVFVRRLRGGQPAGPLWRIAPGDVVDRWQTESSEPEPPSSIETLLRFLRLDAPDGDAALEVAAAPHDENSGAVSASEDGARVERTALLGWSDAMQAATGDACDATNELATLPAFPAGPTPTTQAALADRPTRRLLDTPSASMHPAPPTSSPDSPGELASNARGASAAATATAQSSDAAGEPSTAPAALSSSNEAMGVRGTSSVRSTSSSDAAGLRRASSARPSSSDAAGEPGASRDGSSMSSDAADVRGASARSTSSGDGAAVRGPASARSSNDAAARGASSAESTSSTDAASAVGASFVRSSLSSDAAGVPGAGFARSMSPSSAVAAPGAPSTGTLSSSNAVAPGAPSAGALSSRGVALVPDAQREAAETTRAATTATRGSSSSSAAPAAGAPRGSLPPSHDRVPAPSSSHGRPMSIGEVAHAPRSTATATPDIGGPGPSPAPGALRDAPGSSSSGSGLSDVPRGSTGPTGSPAARSGYVVSGARARLDDLPPRSIAAPAPSDASRASADSGPPSATPRPTTANDGQAPGAGAASSTRATSGARFASESTTANAARPARTTEVTRGEVTRGEATRGEAAAGARPEPARPGQAEAPSGRAADAHPPTPRGRIATARRAQDDLGLPAHSAAGVEAAPAAHAGVESTPAARAGSATPDRAATATSSGPQPTAARRPHGQAAPTVHATRAATLAPTAAAGPPRRTVDGSQPAIPAVEGTGPAAVARSEEAAVAARSRGAGTAVNQEIHIGDVVVELGEPLPPRRKVEHAGSLLASLPRPALRPRRRL